MPTVFKYDLSEKPSNWPAVVRMPKDARIIGFAHQHSQFGYGFKIWAEVGGDLTASAEIVDRMFLVQPTGVAVGPEWRAVLTTINVDGGVWHLFERRAAVAPVAPASVVAPEWPAPTERPVWLHEGIQLARALDDLLGGRLDKFTAEITPAMAAKILEVVKTACRPGHAHFLPGEPVFIIRARDNSAPKALAILDGARVYDIRADVLQSFLDWRESHRDECKD